MKEKYVSFSLILTLIGTISSLISLFNISDINFVLKLVGIFIPILLSFIILVIWKFLICGRKINFYLNRNNPPKLFNPNQMLKYIQKKNYDLCVIGRTNCYWFYPECNHNSSITSDRNRLIKEAIDVGCHITFIVQKKNYFYENLDEETNKKIQKDLEKTIDIFKNIKGSIENGGNKKNLQLKFTEKEIENSMTRISTSQKNIPYFTYDIGQNDEKRPFIIFKKNTVFHEFRKKFNFIEENSILLEEYEELKIKVIEEIEDLIKINNQYSLQREDSVRKIINLFLERRFKRSGYNCPISIQLLITNECSTNCIMCNHNEITSTEITTQDIKRILDYINDLGTKNIIISGGEPLCHKDCIDILSYAKNDAKLNVGLLTNGLPQGAKPLTAEEANSLCKTCDWIQISLDSFNKEIYEKIRCGANFDSVKKSILELEKAGDIYNTNIEICYTIQHENISEAIKIIKNEIDFDFKSKVRFKFAHGPDPNNKFLLNNDDDEKKLTEFVRNCNESQRFNTKYLRDMFYHNYFDKDNVLKGSPVENKTKEFTRKNYKCHVIRYTCKIDATGNVYPCCFLYDDNQGENSILRKKHCKGKLFDKYTKSVMPLNELTENPLKAIWERMATEYNEIPLDDTACYNCTRHFYQNEILNKLEEIIDDQVGAKEIYEEIFSEEEQEKFWL